MNNNNLIPKLIEWLSNCRCENIKPVRVTIGKQSWIGCQYDQILEYTQGMLCVCNGEHKAGEKYTENKIYLIGALPKAKNRQFVCFPFQGQDWYVAGYIAEIKEGFKNFHPFGSNFLLSPWNIPNIAIDAGEAKPYIRMAMTVEPIN
jgi:hypothetical protein